jgi:hypothetical protein
VGNNVVAIVDGLASDVPTAMQIPPEARGEAARITITNKSGMLHGLMVYAKA